MAFIITPRRTIIKPDHAVINVAHPSARGLVVACLTDGPSTSVRNLVNNTRATPTGTQLFNRVGKHGRGMLNADGGSNYYDTTANLPDNFTLISFQAAVSGAYQCILDDDPVSSNRAFQYRTTDTDCVEFIRFNTGGDAFLVTHDTPLTASELRGFHMAATSNGTDLAVWSNKRKFTGSLTGTPQTPNSTVRALQIKGGSTYLQDLLYYWYAWNRVLSDGEICAIMDDPLSLITRPTRRYYTTAPAGGDTTANLSGVSATGSAGSFTITGGASVTLSGVSATGSAGTITASGGIGVSVTGVSATGSAGSLTVTGGASVTLSGVSATGSAGDISVDTAGNVTVNLTGVSATGSAGTLTVTGGATVNLSGVSATGHAGDITVDNAVHVTVNLSGVAATGSAGTLSVTGTSTHTLSGVSATGYAGTILATGDTWQVVASASGSWSVVSTSSDTWTIISS